MPDRRPLYLDVPALMARRAERNRRRELLGDVDYRSPHQVAMDWLTNQGFTVELLPGPNLRHAVFSINGRRFDQGGLFNLAADNGYLTP